MSPEPSVQSMQHRIPRTFARWLPSQPGASLSVPLLGLLLPALVLLSGCRGGEPGGPGPTAGSSGFGGSVDRGPHSVVLVTLDTTRADRLEPYGASGARTPALARLAREGVVFERAYAVTPVTLPSHASLLTGLWPFQHGVRNNGIHHLEDRLTTLPERLAEGGWRTAAFVSAAVLERRYGLDQGFEVYDDDLSAGGPRGLRSMVERPGPATVAAARSWLDGLGEGERFFLWVHLFEPHAPWEPPEPWATDLRDSPYDGEIAAMDAAVGALLDHPRLEGTAVVAVGDHGEGLGEHGERTHGMLVYDSTMRVPLVVRLPRGPAGLRVAEPVSQVDLAPTLEDLLQLPAVPGPEAGKPRSGISWLPLLEGEEGPDRELYGESHVAFHAYGWAKLRALWSPADGSFLKLIEAPTPELYDLEEDPGEQDDLAPRRPGQLARLGGELEELAGEGDGREAAASPDRQAQERLRSLGYLSSGGGRRAGGPRPDPKELIGVHEDLQRVGVLLETGRTGEAVRELRRVLARDPDNPTALQDLARALSATGRLDDAAAALGRALALDPSSVELHLSLADLELKRGEPGRALELARLARELDPRSEEAILEEARFLALLGRREEARRALAPLVEAGSNNPWAELRWAELIELPAGDLAAAQERLERVMEMDPHLTEARLLLGEVLERRGRPARAAEVYRRGLELLPREGRLHGRLGQVLAQLGDPAADESLERALETLPPGADQAPVLQNLAALALQRRDWGRAEAWAERAVEADPRAAAAWNSLGVAREEQGRAARAEEAYRRALEIEPDYWQARFNLGLLLRKEGRFRAAVEAFRGVLEQAPGHAGAHYELGLLQAGPLADREAARRHLEAALEAAPDHPRAGRIRELLGRL